MATPNLNITHVVESQANKETTINLGLDALDNAMNTVESYPVAAGSVTLTAAQFRAAHLFRLTGSPGATRFLRVPSGITKFFAVQNQSDSDVIVETFDTGTDAVTVAAGEIKLLYADGADIYAYTAGTAAASPGGGGGSDISVSDGGSLVTAAALGFNFVNAAVYLNSDGTVDVDVGSATGDGSSGVTVGSATRTLIETIDVSASPTNQIDITDLADYDEVIVQWVGLNAAATFREVVVVSEDNGSSFLSTSGDYRYTRTDAGTNDFRTTDAYVFFGIDNTTARDGRFHLRGMKSSVPKDFTGYSSEDGWQIQGVVDNAAPINAIRIYELGLSTNFNAGTVYVWGIKYSKITISEKTADYQITNADLAGQGYIEMNSASPLNVDVPAGLTGTEPVTIERKGAGTVTFTEDSGVVINSAGGVLTIGEQYATATLIPKGSDEYTLIGNLG